MYDRAPKKPRRSTRRLGSWLKIPRSKKLWRRGRSSPAKSLPHSTNASDSCEQPAKLSGRLQETFIEDFRRELAEVQGPIARRIFALMKLNHLAHFRIAEYRALIAAAEAVGNHGVSLLLETCLDRKSTRLNSSHGSISYAVFCLKK